VIILFCGIPGSGKSTIAEMLANRLAALGQVRILSSDKLRPPVYQKFFRALAPDQTRPDFLILDATFYKEKWREQVRSLAQGEELITVYLDCPLEVTLQRNRTRQPNISEKAMHIIFHQMRPPENPNLRIDTATSTAIDATAKIFEFIADQRRVGGEKT
jgi:adenylylsulfate kinase-like enzyme